MRCPGFASLLDALAGVRPHMKRSNTFPRNWSSSALHRLSDFLLELFCVVLPLICAWLGVVGLKRSWGIRSCLLTCCSRS